MALLPTTIEVSAKDIPEVRAALAVFLDLLQQVDAFIEEQGEADFYTGPARAMRALLAGKTPEEHLRRGLDKFLAERGIAGVIGTAATHPPCTVCGTAYEKHGSYPTCASHPYSPDGRCGHVGIFADGRFTGVPCAGAECRNGCARAAGVEGPEHG